MSPQIYSVAPPPGYRGPLHTAADASRALANQPVVEICPICHFVLPDGWRQGHAVCIVMAGARATGKSIYIAVLIKQLELLCESLGVSMEPANASAAQAYAINYEGKDEVVMSIFGDGATNIGAFHESLNVAKLWHLPIVFVCVNNLYGMGTAVNRASAVTEIWKKACAYDMTGERVDGMDVLAVRRITDQLVAQAREQHEPSLLECVTYRYRGHSMSDPDTYRGKDEIKEWQTRDAILGLGEHLKKQKMLTDQDIQRIDEEVTAQVEDAVKFAEESPDPDPKDLYRDVYADEAAS